ncbi:hypothetical protein [Sphingomonas sp. ERG5]|uniref:hypothetical protein n=1 Tax=Sphingomonas sp. ERG5 TaxID=1381597 RepID=UPI001269C26B|nr:hypothetical protein [Sphingomonas sp. ERG5]
MPTLNENSLILGEMRGQLRDVVYSVNNLSAKLDGLTREVVGLGPLASDIADLKDRIATLEAASNRSEGARTLGTLLLKSPAIGWLVGLAATAWAILSGKAHL